MIEHNLADEGRRLANTILDQRERCAKAPLNRTEYQTLLQLQCEFLDWERSAVLADLDVIATLQDVSDDLDLLRPPAQPMRFEPRRQLSFGDHWALRNATREPVRDRAQRLRKQELVGMPTCGGELND